MDNIDLKEYMVNKDKPKGDSSYGWGAGQQIEALQYYLDNEKVTFLAEWQEDDYQGECAVVFKVDNIFIIWRDSFGSCSGCDALEDEDGYAYISDTLREGNTKQFTSLDSMLEWVKNVEDYMWEHIRSSLLKLIDTAMGNNP